MQPDDRNNITVSLMWYHYDGVYSLPILWYKEAANELERQAEQCADDNVMGVTTKKIVDLMKQIEPFLK